MALKIEGLECRIKSTNILRACSLEVGDRDIVCLLGRNGAGKSTILKNIIGLYLSQGGRILLDGKDITAFTPRERVMAGIAYAPEDSRLFGELSVLENIRLGSWISEGKGGTATFDLEKAYEIFPAIRKLAHRRAETLSGGEKKMVSISRALALNPSLLLLDESFEGLSPLVVQAFSEAMENIRETLGVSILLAESNVHNAAQVARGAYIIDRGEIIFNGKPQEILENEELLKLVGK